MKELNSELRNYLFTHLYKNPLITEMNQTGKSIIKSLFQYYSTNKEHLPEKYINKIKNKNQKETEVKFNTEEIIANYIAGMTDRFAIKQYNLYC